MKLRIGILRFVLLFFFLCGLVWFIFSRGPITHSDVPVTYEVGWWPYQDNMKISEFTAEAVDPHLNLFSHIFVMRFHLKGIIQSRDGRKFRIGEVQLTGRVDVRSPVTTGTSDYKEPVADVLLVPIVMPVGDSNALGKVFPFDLTIEHAFSTMDWGKKHYVCTCGGKSVEVDVRQLK